MRSIRRIPYALVVSLQDEWGERSPRTQIIAIGAAGSIDSEPARKDLRLLHFVGNPSHVIAQLRESTLFEEKQHKPNLRRCILTKPTGLRQFAQDQYR